MHIDSVEFVKDLVDVFLLDSDTGILDAHYKSGSFVYIAFLFGYTQMHTAFLRVFNGVIQKIDDYLTNSYFIAKETVRKAFIDIHDVFDSFAFGFERNHVADII